jgi:predicted nucleic acid-binding Zn ribbon protein
MSKKNDYNLKLDFEYYLEVINQININSEIDIDSFMECPICNKAILKTSKTKKYCSEKCGKLFAELRYKLIRHELINETD